MKKIILFLLFLGTFSQIVSSQQIDKAKIDQYFEALEKNQKFMGSVAVSKNGENIYKKTIGFVDIAKQIKANENSKYRIGSISKTFTAILIFKAVEDKNLDLNQSIDKYFPTIKNAKKISISNLLYHRSGIFNFTNDKDYLNWNSNAKTEQEMVSIIASYESVFEPNSIAEYSNSNYILLTYILEKTFKKSYAKLIEEYIVQPLGLKNTFFGRKINTLNNECQSYSYKDTWQLESETDSSILLGAGGMVSNANDLVIFSDALFQGKLISKESLTQMKLLKDNYGMGLFQIPFYDKIGYGHTGGVDGFGSVFSYFSTGDISFALTSNATNFNNNNIAIAVLSAVYQKPFEIPEFKVYHINPEDLDQYLGIYTSAQIPLKITISKEKNSLIAQATGQPSFPLEASDKNIFKFEQAGVVLEFNPEKKTMILKQNGMVFNFNIE